MRALGISTLLQEAPRELAHPFHHVKKKQSKVSAMCQEKRPHKNVTILVPQSQTFQPPDCEKYISVVYKLRSLWYFIMAVQMN